MTLEKTLQQEGFTFVELLISLAIGLIVLIGLVNTFLLERRIFDGQEQKVEALQTARAAINMISQEVMMAGYNPLPGSTLQQENDVLSTFTGIVYDPYKLELEIRTDINGDGEIVYNDTGSNPDNWEYDTNERIVYRKNGDQIQRKTGGGSFQPFAENVIAFQFNFLKSNGSVATHEADIRVVEILIEIETDRPEIGVGYKTKQLSSMVAVRNMGL